MAHVQDEVMTQLGQATMLYVVSKRLTECDGGAGSRISSPPLHEHVVSGVHQFFHESERASMSVRYRLLATDRFFLRYRNWRRRRKRLARVRAFRTEHSRHL